MQRPGLDRMLDIQRAAARAWDLVGPSVCQFPLLDETHSSVPAAIAHAVMQAEACYTFATLSASVGMICVTCGSRPRDPFVASPSKTTTRRATKRRVFLLAARLAR